MKAKCLRFLLILSALMLHSPGLMAQSAAIPSVLDNLLNLDPENPGGVPLMESLEKELSGLLKSTPNTSHRGAGIRALLKQLRHDKSESSDNAPPSDQHPIVKAAKESPPNNSEDLKEGEEKAASSDLPRPLKIWKSLLGFRPSQEIQNHVMAHQERQLQFLGGGPAYFNWFVQRIEDGVYPVSLDYYPVHLRQMPTIQGRELAPEKMLDFIRFHLNGFTTRSFAYFEPYNYTAACIDMKLGGYVYIALANDTLNHAAPNGAGAYHAISMESGSVVISHLDNNSWRFSTIYANGHRYLTDSGGNHSGTPRSQTSNGGFYHPVSGNREFGFQPHPDGGWVFYTCGADRLSRWSFVPEALRMSTQGEAIDTIVDLGRLAPSFLAQRLLWQNMQKRIVAFVNSAGGDAVIPRMADGSNFVQEFWQWNTIIKQGLHEPVVPWINTRGAHGRYWADKAPTRDSAFPQIVKALDQIDSNRPQRDPPRVFRVPDWMNPLEKHLPR
jgi:hypothetical protein